MRFKRVTQSSLAVLMATVFGGFAHAESVVRFVPSADLNVLDPVTNTSPVVTQFAFMIYDQLFGVDGNLVAKPQMVDTFTQAEDGKHYSFTLRSGLKFSDGAAVRSADAIGSITRWSKSDIAGQKMAAAGMKLKAVDDRTFTMDFDTPFTSAIDVMAKPSWPLFVFPERDTVQPPTQPVTDAVGSGPFRFVKSEWQPGSKLVFEKNPDYVPRSEPADGYAGGKVVKVDRVEWNIIPDGNTAMAALQNGEVDVVEHISNDMVPALKADKNITLKVFNKVGVQAFLTMNQKQPPFNNVKARQALLYLVNQADYMRAVAGDQDFWQVCWAYLMCNSPAGTEIGAEMHKTPDLDKAKALLKEAGYKGERIVLYAATGIPAMPEEAQVLAQELQQIGVNVDVQQMDYNTLLSKRRNSGPIDQGGWNLLPIWAFGPNQMNPLTNSSLSATCDQNTAYPGWACSAELEALRSQWAGAPQNQRKQLGEQIQKTGLDTVVTVPLGQFYQPVAYRAALTGVLQTPYFAMWNLDKKQ